MHRCATGQLVVIHDDELVRTTDGAGYVKDSSLAELKRLSAGLWFDPEFKDERLPLLSEVLDLFDIRTLVNIEVKNAPAGYAGIEKDLLAELEPYRSRLNIVVSSFDHHCLRKLRSLDAELEIGILAAASLVDAAEYCAKFAASFYIQNYNCLLPEAVKAAQDSGLKLIVWTVNDILKWRQLIEMGVYAICTDQPQALQAYYKELRLNP